MSAFIRPFICILITFAVSASLFASPLGEQKIVTGTVLLQEKTAPDFRKLQQSLKTTWKLSTDSVNISDKTMIFTTTGGITVMIAYLPYAAAPDEVGAAARLSTLWINAAEQTRTHQAQLVLSVIGPAHRTLDLYKVLTQSLAASLEATRSSGVFLSAQYLVVPHEFWVTSARNMLQNQALPLYCWVYFGMPGGNNAFTYGLQEFGLPEMEIANSTRPAEEVRAVLYDATLSVVKYNTLLSDGQSVTTEEGQKIPVKKMPSAFVQGQEVLRLEY